MSSCVKRTYINIENNIKNQILSYFNQIQPMIRFNDLSSVDDLPKARAQSITIVYNTSAINLLIISLDPKSFYTNFSSLT